MVTFQRWIKFGFAQQLGNIGSELSRARTWEESQDIKARDKSLVVALELIDLSLEDKRWGSGLKEIARLRDVVADWHAGTNVYEVSRKSLEDYCTSFILAEYRHN